MSVGEYESVLTDFPASACIVGHVIMEVTSAANQKAQNNKSANQKAPNVHPFLLLT